jgi:serine/threonine protein kinase
LDRVCGTDRSLRDRVEGLLGAHVEGDGFLESPAAAPTVTVTPDGHIGPEEPGTTIGPYKLMEQIGEGGMGVVYVAEQHQPVRRKVALKIIKPGMDTKQVIARFEAERQALAMMDHPSIARVLDGGATASGRPFFVMELVRGIPITDYCDREQLSIPERLDLFVLVCRAVQHAHQKGVIHRDLKPSNILVTVIDAAVPKVIDFGVAKATGASLTERTLYTALHQFVGTPLYMSPEQADLSGMDVDTRSDIYSLGVLLYELLTGTTPFDQATFRQAAFDELRRLIREQEPPKPSTRLSSLGATRATVSANRKADARHPDRAVRGELDWIVMKALEKDWRRRYETATDFAADIMRYLTDQPVEACPPSAWYRLRKFVQRNKGPVAAGLALAALLVLGTVGTSVGLVWAMRAEAKAKEEAAIAKAVNDFLREDLLAQASPEKHPNRDLKLRTVLDLAAGRIAGRLAQQPLVEAAIRQTIGDTYRALGLPREARSHLERARDLRLRVLGEEQPETLEATTSLAATLSSDAQSDKAEPLLVRVIEVGQRDLGKEHLQVLRATNELGGLYQGRGQLVKAEPLLVKSLEGCRRVLGEGHPQTLSAMHNLAALYRSQGKLPEARSLVVRMLELNRRDHGEEYPDTLEAMHDLALLYKREKKLEEAESLLVKVVEIRRRVQGEAHPDTLGAIRTLATLYQDQGKFAQAEQLWLKALEISRRDLGEDHLETLGAMDFLAVMYRAQGKPSEAEALFIKALEGYRRVQGEEHSDTLNTMNCLACLYHDQGKLSQAEPLFVKAMETSRRVRGEEHPGTLRFMINLARLYQDQGKFAQAESLWVKVLEIRRRVLGEEHPDTLLIMHALAGLYWDMGKLTKAEPLYVKNVEIGRRVLGESHPDMLIAARNLAYFYSANMKFERSIPLFEDVLKWTRDKLGPDHPDTLNTMDKLGESYRYAGRLPEATELLEQALVNARKQPDPLAGDLVRIPIDLGLTFEQVGRFGQAESLYREALETVRLRHAEGTSHFADLQASLAMNLLKQQRYAEAEPLLHECLKFREQNAANDYVTYYTKSLLGGSLLGQKKYAEAEPLLLAGYEGMKQREAGILPFRMFRLTEAIERLVQLYEATGKKDKAAEWRKKLTAAKPSKPAEAKKR